MVSIFDLKYHRILLQKYPPPLSKARPCLRYTPPPVRTALFSHPGVPWTMGGGTWMMRCGVPDPTPFQGCTYFAHIFAQLPVYIPPYISLLCSHVPCVGQLSSSASSFQCRAPPQLQWWALGPKSLK